MQCQGLPSVAHMKRCDRTTFHKVYNVTHKLFHMERCDETTFHKMHNVTHLLLGIATGVMRSCLSQNMQCHSLAVGHRKICDETACHKMFNVAHKLLVMGKDVMRLSSMKYVPHRLFVKGV